MAKKKPEFDPKKWWRCEHCGTAHEGDNPPDECTWCGHNFFGNLADEQGLFGDTAPAKA